VNPSSPLIQNALKIWEKGNKPLVNKICHHVQDLAGISSEGLSTEEKEQFVQRSQELIQELSGYAL
jgi:molecular chaperone HtpG